MDKPRKILFICTGNSCRSVIARALFEKMIRESNSLNLDEFSIDSAGTNPLEGMSATKETLKVLLSEGIDASSHRAKKATTDMINDANIILAMQSFHKEIIQSMSKSQDKVYLLKEFCSSGSDKESNLDIFDPIGKPLEVYEGCLITIKDCLEKIIKRL